MAKKTTNKLTEVAARMFALFAGYDQASGTHGVPTLDPNGLKWSIKKTAQTLKLAPTAKLWEQHLEGKRPLGVVPIMADSMCMWGSIDIDKYDVDHLEVIKNVEALKLPLVPCRSKSNGMHLFLFLREPTQAALVQLTLRNLAAVLGFADSEIFPKQTHILKEQGDSGNWMVMPYYGDTYNGKLKLQYGLKKTGAEMTVEEFLTFAERSRVTEAEVAELRQRTVAEDRVISNGKKKREKKPFGDGPPCLQIMAEGGFPEGGRNSALMHMGVYLKKAEPANWKEVLAENNQKFMVPPLPAEEVVSVQKQLEKKDYEYLCKQAPMCNFCDSVTCRTRKYGVGNDAWPEIISLRKLMSEPALWFVDIMGPAGTVTLSMGSEQLQYFNKFQTLCIEHANVVQRNVPPAAWTSIIQEAMARAELIEAPPDLRAGGRFRELLSTFLTNRTHGLNREDLLRGVPWEDEERGRYYFRLRDLEAFLKREGEKFNRAELTEKIKALHPPGSSPEVQVKVKKNTVIQTRWVSYEMIERATELDTPEPPKEEI